MTTTMMTTVAGAGARLAAGAALALFALHAAAQEVRVMVSGEVAPGVYGRVDIGTGPRPPLVSPDPVVAVRQARAPGPVYLHVPPGHQKNWAKHCKRYDACSRPVYFVKSAEYEPGYRHPGKGAEKSAAKSANKAAGKGRDR